MSISIFLIRNSLHSKVATDDTVEIRREGDNILVTYKDCQNARSSGHTLLLKKDDLSRYIQNIGYLFLNDTEPFTEAQFNFPGFPCFLVNQKSLKNTDTQDALMEIAEMVSESWFLDEMPPLIPLKTCCEDDYSRHY